MENKSKRIQIDARNIHYTKRNVPPSGVHINNVQLPQKEDVKHLVLHLDRRRTCHKHIFAKWKQPGITLAKMYLLLGRKSNLSTSNTLLICKTMLKQIWTHGIQLQSKALRMIVDAPWFVPNTIIRRDLQTPTVKEEIRRYSSPQRTPKRPSSEPHGATRQQQAIAKTPAK
jgi:hypothetical protein